MRGPRKVTEVTSPLEAARPCDHRRRGATRCLDHWIGLLQPV